MNQYEMKKLAYQSNLRNRALQVLLYLIDRANKEQTCFPAVRTIARELHISVSTVKRAMQELVESGYVTKESRFRESNGGQTSNLYTLYFPKKVGEEWKEEEQEKSEPVSICLSFSVRLAQYEELILIPFWITAVILGWHIIKMAPIEHKNRILIEDERRIFRRRSIQIYIFWLVVGIILWMVRLVQMETSLISAFIAITILMRIGGISNYEKRSASGVSKSGE